MLLRPGESKAFQVSTGSSLPKMVSEGGGGTETEATVPSPSCRAAPRIALVVKGRVVGLPPERDQWAETEAQLRRQYHFGAPPFHRRGIRGPEG